MNTSEFPPKDGEIVESFNPETPIDHEEARALQKALEEQEKPRAKETQAERDIQSMLLVNAIKEHREKPVEKMTFEPIATLPKGSIRSTAHQSWFKRALVAGTAFFALGGTAKAHEHESKENRKSKTETTVSKDRNKLQENPGVALYTKSNTESGGITPTGLSNSFLENKFGITAEDIVAIAKEKGFRTDNTINFQSDMVDYLQKNNPDALMRIQQEYQLPSAGTLKDGLLGVRSADMLSVIKHEIKKPITPEHTISPSPEAPQPKGRYIVNVRGNEPGDKGAYYFIENESDFKRLLKLVPSFSSAETEKDGGQVSYDMNQSVFNKYHANNPEVQRILGQDYLKNKNNSQTFVQKNTTSHSSVDIAKN